MTHGARRTSAAAVEGVESKGSSQLVGAAVGGTVTLQLACWGACGGVIVGQVAREEGGIEERCGSFATADLQSSITGACHLGLLGHGLCTYVNHNAQLEHTRNHSV